MPIIFLINCENYHYVSIISHILGDVFFVLPTVQNQDIQWRITYEEKHDSLSSHLRVWDHKVFGLLYYKFVKQLFDH